MALRDHIVLVCAATLLSACSNSAELRVPLEVPPPENKAIVEIIDEYCTKIPEQLELLRERNAFYLTYNDTANTNDPPQQPCPTCLDTTQRVDLIAKVQALTSTQSTDRLAAVLTYTNTVTDRTGGFIDDAASIAQGLVGSSGGVEEDVYSVIVNAADLIKTNLLEEQSQEVTRYNIFLTVTDLPNVPSLPGNEDQTLILNEVDTLVQLQNDFNVFDITLNVVLLAQPLQDTLAAETFYQQMVAKTGGKLVVVRPLAGGPDAVVNATDFDFVTSVIDIMNFGPVMVFNRSMRFINDPTTGIGQLFADSDRDGLTDDEEAELGTDPLDKDSDGDYLQDATEVLLGTDPTVASFNCLPADQTDTDLDGLFDCEELSLGADPMMWDTDFDGIPDDLEVIHRLNILQDDANEDEDLDGLTNIKEIKLGLDPIHSTSEADVDKFGNRYEVTVTENVTAKQKCMQLEVQNVALLNNLNAAQNVIEVQIQQEPNSAVPVKVLDRINYQTLGILDNNKPANIKIFIDPLDAVSVEQKKVGQ